MKKIVLLFSVFFILKFHIKAQDSLSFKEFRLGFGLSDAGINLYNKVGSEFNIQQKGSINLLTSASAGFNIKKFAFELGIDKGGQTNYMDSNLYTIGMTVSNLRLNFKYSLFNNWQNQINILSELGAQSIEFNIDSSSGTTKLFDLTSTVIEKDLIMAGIGIEYIYKLKIKNNRAFVYGTRVGYNLYIQENHWSKGYHVKYSPSGFKNNVTGNFYGTIFLGYRLYKM
ncbi:MAG: hypothetical protein ACKVQB_09285 [Bacteroidia bacterium]